MAKETLVVKNFGPIREAELDLRKVTVFIGEQASGKSVLAKIFTILNDFDFNSGKTPFKVFTKRYGIDFSKPDSFLFYKNDVLSVTIDKEIPNFQYTENYKNLVNAQKELKPLLDKYIKTGGRVSTDPKILNLFEKFLKMPKETLATTAYIPAERLIASLIAEAPFGFFDSRISLPEYLKIFGKQYDESRRNVTQVIIENLELEIEFKQRAQTVKYKGISIPFSKNSTGLQALAPLVILLENFAQREDYSSGLIYFLIEEPELNLYPTTQKKLVEYLIEKCTQGNNRLIITTHSPYILTALNNCIEAKNVIKANPETAEEVNKMVLPQYQLDYEDVMAYFVGNGTAKPIMNEEYQIIDANALDEVSDDLGRVFDRLLDLKYQNQD